MKHAAILVAIAAGQTVQTHNAPGTSWFDVSEKDLPRFNPLIQPHWEWRIKPDKINIAGRELDAPLRSVPAVGTQYWAPSLVADEMYVHYTWVGNRYNHSHFERGVCYDAPEKAVAVAEALLSLG